MRNNGFLWIHVSFNACFAMTLKISLHYCTSRIILKKFSTLITVVKTYNITNSPDTPSKPMPPGAGAPGL